MEELRKKTTLFEFNEMLEDTFEKVTKYLIVAAQYGQARDFAKVMGIPKAEWKFVNQADDFRGYCDFVIVTLGGMRTRNDIYEILDAANTMIDIGRAKKIHVEDWR